MLKEVVLLSKINEEIELPKEERIILGLLRSLEKREKDTKTGEFIIDEKTKLKPTKEGILAYGKHAFKAETDSYSNFFDPLVTKKLLRFDGTVFILTEKGRLIGKQVLAKWQSSWYNSALLRSAKSQAHAQFCERVFGKNLYQFDVLDMEQLDTLINKMKLKVNDYILDIGCGLGKIDEYISDKTGAKFLGIDFAEELVKWALEQTTVKRDRLNYQVMNINDLDFPAATFDSIISIDSLYFVDDLNSTIKKLRKILKPKGRLGIFYAQYRAPHEPLKLLKPNGTKVALALKANGFSFEAINLTENGRNIWVKEIAAATDLKEQFEKEGNLDLCEGRLADSKETMAKIDNQQETRYFYLCKKI